MTPSEELQQLILDILPSTLSNKVCIQLEEVKCAGTLIGFDSDEPNQVKPIHDCVQIIFKPLIKNRCATPKSVFLSGRSIQDLVDFLKPNKEDLIKELAVKAENGQFNVHKKTASNGGFFDKEAAQTIQKAAGSLFETKSP